MPCVRVPRCGRRARSALLALLARSVGAHLSFRLPSMPGVSPGGAGGYVPFDGNYLSNSPLLLSVPHSKPGNITVALQCTAPGGFSVTPHEVPGYDLTLNVVGTTTTAFTYQLQPDSNYPDGFAQPAHNRVAGSSSGGVNTAFSAQIGFSVTATACNFSDAAGTALVGGYPSIYLRCAQVTLPETVLLTPGGFSALISASVSGASPLGVLLWTATPGTAGPAVTLGSNASLDAFSTSTAVNTGCTSWPCSVAQPFGGASARVLEAANAPSFKLLPQGCTGLACVTPFAGSPFTGCPLGQLTMATSVSTFTAPNGAASVVTGLSATPVAVGNAMLGTASASAPTAKLPLMSNDDLTIWLAVLTAVYSFIFLAMAIRHVHNALSSAAQRAPVSTKEGVTRGALVSDQIGADGV